MSISTKSYVKDVFDSLAEAQSWENLYKGNWNRITYNFITRQRAVEELLTPFAKGKVLDLGCGSGDLLPFFARHCQRYIGVDLSEQMTKRAEDKYAKNMELWNAQFAVGDCEHLSFQDEDFDIVAAVALIEYLPDPSSVLNEIARVTKTGGLALVTVPHKSCINFKIRTLFAPIRNLLFPLYTRIKKPSLGKMRDVKHTHYNPQELDALMMQRSFQKIGERFTNFYFIFHPLDHLIPGIYMKLSELADRSACNALFCRWASNYVALYQKVASDF